MNDADLITQISAKLEDMPPVSALRLQVAALDDAGCTLKAPLAANVNDKGCAFGGSLVSLMTLAGWSLVTGWLERRGIEAEVYVADSQVKYRAPVYDDLDARARFRAALDEGEVMDALREKGRASFLVQAGALRGDGRTATSMESRYVAVLPE